MNELVVINESKEKEIEIFSTPKGLEPILVEIRKQLDEFVPDMTTNKGRNEIRTMAQKVRNTKSYIDGKGKDLVAELKDIPKKIDAERKRVRDTLDKWRDEVRKPLTDWENAEKERVKFYENKLRALEGYLVPNMELPSDLLKTDLSDIENYEITDEWKEFKEKGLELKQKGIDAHTAALEKVIKAEKEREELERLRKAEEERKRKEHEENLKKEAAEKARREAEEKALKEKEEYERKQREHEEQIKRQEKERAEAEKRAEQARLDAIEKEKQLKLQAEREKQEAIEAEKRRQAQEEEKKRKEKEERQANVKHRKKINNEALKCLMKIDGVSESLGKQIIEAVAKNEISNVKIQY
tara:strand:+ start:370 stop:1434 length:1065 start_codon:yes stop_codon:yes gene_type:complete